MSRRLDEIDKRIIYALVQDARNTSAPMVAEEVDVSAGTIRNRIKQLEEDGVIAGYHAHIDFGRCEGRLTNLFICNTSVSDREKVAREVLKIPGVVNVRELRTGRGNLQIKAVGEDMNELTNLAEQISELGVDIEDEDLIQQEFFAPYQPFGPDSGGENSVMTDVMSLSGGAEVVDVTVDEDAPIVDTTLGEATDEGLLDDQLLIIAIERGDEILTPKGNTKIHAGDLVSVFSRDGVPETALRSFRSESELQSRL